MKRIVDYNLKDPVKYENRHLFSQRELYIRNHWLPIFLELLRKYCNEGFIVDLGCGTGNFTRIIKKYYKNVIGIDIAEKWLLYAKRLNPELEFIHADCQSIPLKNNSVDAVISWGLFEYIDRNVTISEISRITKAEGICIILVPNKFSIFRMPNKILSKILLREPKLDEPSKFEMIRFLKKYDFKIIELVMNDALIPLPDIIDNAIGLKLYQGIEKFFKFFGQNPFSNIMIIVGKKIK